MSKEIEKGSLEPAYLHDTTAVLSRALAARFSTEWSSREVTLTEGGLLPDGAIIAPDHAWPTHLLAVHEPGSPDESLCDILVVTERRGGGALVHLELEIGGDDVDETPESLNLDNADEVEALCTLVVATMRKRARSLASSRPTSPLAA